MKEKKDTLRMLEYNDHALAVVGKTKKYKADLKKMGGRYSPHIKCGPGWVFSARRRKELERYITARNTEEEQKQLSFDFQ